MAGGKTRSEVQVVRQLPPTGDTLPNGARLIVDEFEETALVGWLGQRFTVHIGHNDHHAEHLTEEIAERA